VIDIAKTVSTSARDPMLADYRDWDENKRFSIKLASHLIKNPCKDILTWTSYLVIHWRFNKQLVFAIFLPKRSNSILALICWLFS